MQEIVDIKAFIELRKTNFKLGYDPKLTKKERAVSGMTQMFGPPKKAKVKVKAKAKKNG